MTKGLKNSKALGEPYKLPLFLRYYPKVFPNTCFYVENLKNIIMGVYGQEIGSRHYSLHPIVI